MVSRIRIWSSRNISFAGRRQLVNVVLMSVCVYWSQVFLLPKKVLQQVNAIYRSFLWTGTCNSTRPGYVSWDSVCNPKSAGGLGFRSLARWNMVMIGKQAWHVAMKSDNLWVKWIHSMYIQDQNWEDYEAPTTASWEVKTICRVKRQITTICGCGWLQDT